MDKPADNITRFRRDRRLAVVGLLRAFALLFMLMSVIFGVWKYSDELKLDNIRRLISYAGAAAGSGTGFTRYNFEPGLDTVYAPFELGLAVVSSDTYSFVSGFSQSGFSAQLKYASPAICTSDRQALIYDRGNTGYSIVTGYSVVKSAASDSPIIAASMNKNGDYALVTNENGYRAGVYVYDYKNREKCIWQTPNYYVRTVSLSPSGTVFTALCMSEKDGRLLTQVNGYAIGNEQAVYTLDFGEKMIYSVRHYKNGDLFIICEDGLYVYGPDGEQKGGTAFTLTPVMFAHHEGELPMVAMRMNTGAGEQARIWVFDELGDIAYEYQAQDTLRSMDFREGVGMLLLFDKLITIDLTGEDPVLWEQNAAGARKVLIGYAGSGVLVYSDRAERVERGQ